MTTPSKEQIERALLDWQLAQKDSYYLEDSWKAAINWLLSLKPESQPVGWPSEGEIEKAWRNSFKDETISPTSFGTWCAAINWLKSFKSQPLPADHENGSGEKPGKEEEWEKSQILGSLLGDSIIGVFDTWQQSIIYKAMAKYAELKPSLSKEETFDRSDMIGFAEYIGKLDIVTVGRVNGFDCWSNSKTTDSILTEFLNTKKEGV